MLGIFVVVTKFFFLLLIMAKTGNINKPYKLANKSEDILHDLFKKRGFPDAKIPLLWKVIVGLNIAKITKPIKITWQAEKHTKQKYLKRQYIAAKDKDNIISEQETSNLSNQTSNLIKSQFQACLHIKIHKSKILFYQHQIPQILEKINNFYGYSLLNSIKLIASNDHINKNYDMKNNKNTEVFDNDLPNANFSLNSVSETNNDKPSLKDALNQLSKNYHHSKKA